MKKLFTLCLALVGLSSVANAATVDDIRVCKHSYVLVADDYTNNGTGGRAAGNLFGGGLFLDVTGGSVATNKGKIDLSVVDDTLVTAEIAAKYGEYGSHYNSLRLKKAQDVIAMKVTANSKLIIFYQDNNKDDRYPLFAKTADLKEKYATQGTRSLRMTSVNNVRRMEWTAEDDGLVYIGDNNGDMFLSYIIVEAVEAPGTPTITVGKQTFENGLYFKEVTCQANDATEAGSDATTPTVVTYTTDGSTPTATSPKYTEPIKCYSNMTVKFQAFLDIMGDGGSMIDETCLIDGADYDVPIEFSFDAPSITANGADVTISSQYENATNYYTLNGGEEAASDAVTLEESATVKAYSVISNGAYGSFTSKSATQDVYVLDAIKEAKTIKVIAGDVVIDQAATEAATDGKTVYVVENGAISADKKDFFVKNLEFGVVTDAQYQIDGDQRYIKMNNTNISFKVAAGDSVNVKVICSKNSCKNIDADDAAENKQVNGNTPDRSCYVNVSGVNYCAKDAEGKEVCDMKLHPDVANVIEFGLKAGDADKVYTFQKYSGTGNILISSIEITPAASFLLGDVNNDNEITMADANAVVNYYLTPAQYPNFPVESADMNDDDEITMADANAIVNVYLGSNSNDNE
ncbi:MAG: chitobiase/beta-hexosaminidase C-terminal domain-containing protein [Prevotella sp.]|nr:chitobiase/beta-hexosaminidase C-terminal domain-containing protein [Prevotella sp.]